MQKHAVSFCTFVLYLAEGRQAAGKQEDNPACYQDIATTLRAVHSLVL